MATIAYHIRSDYDPEDRERLEVETGQHTGELEGDTEDAWLTEKPFVRNKRIANPPRFVPASTSAEGGGGLNSAYVPPGAQDSLDGHDDLGRWYKSLARASASAPSSLQASAGPSRVNTPTQANSSGQHPRRARRRDWFSDQPSESKASKEPISLADMLSRDPPPMPSDPAFAPPVMLAIGPWNKGFQMLERSGWEEGFAVGKTAMSRQGIRRRRSLDDDIEKMATRAEVIDVDEVIDLTVSDEEDDGLIVEAESQRSRPSSPAILDSSNDEPVMDHDPVTLITPLPTILKADRLGIGLKAKTSGPYRESVKRVTHSQAAMAAHIKAGEKLKQQKNRFGRGRRGFERMKKIEEEIRKQRLAYLTSD